MAADWILHWRCYIDWLLLQIILHAFLKIFFLLPIQNGVTLGPYPIPKPNDFTLIMSDNEELIWTICVCYNNGMACSLFWEEKDFTGHIRRTFWAWCRQRYWQFLFHIAKRLHLTSSIYSIGWMELKVSEAGHENWLQISRKSGIMTFKNFS